ncbi:hypothetical protein [Chryseobacterium taiwanense]|uniref:Uncharacterized protein n=1 Tax=Chryseobacterium taiwanense TaxID=363331 RepID=A0A0B4DH55_9FLAO|nr:hypothetical protein [Chryseobacterium taiwanense]KIC63740.1 hypothetical protein RM51_08805 [Chryseobacterium taiwanense]
MKKLFISIVLLLGLSMNVLAQELPPHPTKKELIAHKRQELDKRYNAERKAILNHPLATKKMKRDQLKALDEKYQSQKKLLKQL